MNFPWPTTPPTRVHREAFAEATVRPYWLDALPGREPEPPLEGPNKAGLCIVGRGFTGLWAALHAKADDPGRDVVVLEADTVGFGASGRNGGFALGSLTHGIENGLARFAAEMPQLARLSRENFQAFVDDIERLGIDCDLELTGDLAVALEPHEVDWLKESAELLDRFGHEHELLDAEAVRPRSPRRPTSPASGTRPTPRSSTRESSRSAWRMRRSAPASVSTSVRARRRSWTRGPPCASRRRPATWVRDESSWRRARTRP